MQKYQKVIFYHNNYLSMRNKLSNNYLTEQNAELKMFS